MIIIYIITQILLENEPKEKYISYFSENVVLFHFGFFIIIKMATSCHEIFETVNVFAHTSSVLSLLLISLNNCFFYISIQLATMQQIILFMLFL